MIKTRFQTIRNNNHTIGNCTINCRFCHRILNEFNTLSAYRLWLMFRLFTLNIIHFHICHWLRSFRLFTLNSNLTFATLTVTFALLLSSDFAFSRVINSLLEIIQIIHVIPQFYVLVGWWGYLWRRYRIELNWIELKQATLRQHVLLSLN